MSDTTNNNPLAEDQKNATDEQLKEQRAGTLLEGLSNQIKKLSEQITEKNNEISDKDRENFEKEVSEINNSIGLAIESLKNLQKKDEIKEHVDKLEQDRTKIKENQEYYKKNETEINSGLYYSSINASFTKILGELDRINWAIFPERAHTKSRFNDYFTGQSASQQPAPQPQQTNAPQQQPAAEPTAQSKGDATPKGAEQVAKPQEDKKQTETADASKTTQNTASADVHAGDATAEQPEPQPQSKAEELTWETAYEMYEKVEAKLNPARDAFNSVYASFRNGNASLSSLDKLLTLVNKKYNGEYNEVDKKEKSYNELIDSLNSQIDKIIADAGLNIEELGIKIDRIRDEKSEELKSIETNIGEKIENAYALENRTEAAQKAEKLAKNAIAEVQKQLDKENKTSNGLDRFNTTESESIPKFKGYITEQRTKLLNPLEAFSPKNGTVDQILNKILLENKGKEQEDKPSIDFSEIIKSANENVNQVKAASKNAIDVEEYTIASAGQKEAEAILEALKAGQKATEQIQDLKTKKEALAAAEIAHKKLDALEEIEKLQKAVNEIITAKNTLKDFNQAISEEEEAREVLRRVQEETYVKELVERLKNNQWGKRTTKFNGDEISLNEEINALDEKNQKYLLTKALKRIYNGNDDTSVELQQQLGLNKNNNLDEKTKEGIIDYFIGETVERYFDSYKEELFAEKQPFFEKNRINLAEITNDIVNTFKIKQYEAEQARQQAQQEAIKPTNFQNIVTERTNAFQNMLLEKDGAAKFRENYEKNLNNKEEHELDALALSKLPKETFDKIAPWGLIHGIYGQIKNDQKEVNGDNIEKLLSEHRRNLITNEDTHFIRKPKDIKAFDIAKNIIKHPNSENTRKALKFLCQQQDRSEAWPKSKGKWHGNMLNTVVQQLEKNTFKDAAILKDAFQEIVNDETQGFSITKPMEDKMVYFKIVYTYATEDARNELLENPGFIRQVEKLSKEKKEKLGYFFELIGEGKKDSIKQLNLQQQKSIKNQSLTDDEMVDYVYEHGFDVGIIQGNVSNKETLTPYYLFDENGNSNKNNENLLGKVSFKLQDSFLGLTCAEDKKAGVLKNNTRAKKVRDENGNKIKDKNQRVTGEQVQQQREAEKSAQEAVKRAGGNLKTITEKTMPLLKNTEFKFRINGKEVSLGEAVKVYLKVLQKKQQKEQTLGILQGRIPEKNLMEQVGDMLHLNVENGYFSKKELQSIREAISAQIIATNAFTETFNRKNQALANKLENGREQVMQNQQEEVRQQLTNSALGASQIFGNGQSQEMQQQGVATMNMKSSLLNQQSQDRNQSQPTPSNSGQEADSSRDSTPTTKEKVNSAFPGFNKFSSTAQQGTTQGAPQKQPQQSSNPTEIPNKREPNTKEQSGINCSL